MTASIEVRGISKQFRLYHERFTTLKDRLVHLGRQSYEPYWALKDITCEIEDGRTIGLIGANGSGKTTLLKVMAGILRPTEGQVITRGRVVGLLELGAGFHPDLTGRENIYMNASILGLSKRETEQVFDAIVAYSELEKFIDNQVKHYSSGMYVRLGFAVAVHVEPEILLVDEVLSVGDEAFQEKCLQTVRTFQKQGRTIVFVSHALSLVSSMCHQAFLIEDGSLIDTGVPHEVIRTYRERLHAESPETVAVGDSGTGEIRIVSVKVGDGTGQVKRVLHTGDELQVVVDMDAEQKIDDPVVGVAIFDSRDQVVFGTNTELSGFDLGTVHGKFRTNFRFSQIPLTDGAYQITVAVHPRDQHKNYHRQERAYGFRVVGSTKDVGFVFAASKISLERL